MQELSRIDKPWKTPKNSHRFGKTLKHRVERRRAKQDPDCVPAYRKYAGYEW